MGSPSLLAALRERWAAAGHPPYPWWVPVSMTTCSLLAVLISGLQRIGAHPELPVWALLSIAAGAWLAEFAGVRLPMLLFTTLVTAPMCLLIAAYPVTYDFATLVLVMMVGHVAAVRSTTSGIVGAALAGASIAVLQVAGLFDGSSFAAAALVVGWDVGFLMQYQQRRLDEQERQQLAREEHAAVEERQRIAREVHDVIAHSLSVTLLHLTAARRSLEEEGPDDVQEAVAALRDAELTGREAMADIRRTIGLLGTDRAATAPTVGMEDLPGLVAEFVRAGLDVSFETSGTERGVTASVGLALYRVLQESLANVAKHDPDAAVAVRLDCGTDPGSLVVRSTRRGNQGARTRTPRTDGAGLRGMRERATLLGGSVVAGPTATGWCVEMRFPTRPPGREPGARDTETGRGCPVLDRMSSSARVAGR